MIWGHPLPPFFTSAHSKGVNEICSVSADSKGVKKLLLQKEAERLDLRNIKELSGVQARENSQLQ